MTSQRRYVAVLVAVTAVVFLWSLIRPHDYFTWILEVFPAIFGGIALALLWPRFRFTPLVLTLIAVHMMILMVGGHYTYAEVPLFNVIRDMFHQSRNNYDRVGHFAQGFVPALIAREVLIRRRVVIRRGWLAFLVVCVCLAVSAMYELFEWQTAVINGSSADAFLGTQGDPWDTQEDMATAFIGAVSAVVLLSRWHDRQIARIEGEA